ncbi:MAG: hypothetical protein ACOX3V_01455 [Bacillota bacterium]
MKITDGDAPLDGKGFVEKWRVTIPDDGGGIHTIRFIPPEKRDGLTIYLQVGEEWTEADVQWDGKYMVFQATGNSVTFAIVQMESFYGSVWVLLTAAVSIGLVLAVHWRRRKAII